MGTAKPSSGGRERPGMNGWRGQATKSNGGWRVDVEDESVFYTEPLAHGGRGGGGGGGIPHQNCLPPGKMGCIPMASLRAPKSRMGGVGVSNSHFHRAGCLARPGRWLVCPIRPDESASDHNPRKSDRE